MKLDGIRRDKRNPNFEILRIIAMLMIVSFHVRNSVGLISDLSCAELIILTFLGNWGIVGVDIFIIVTSFFLQTYTRSSWPKFREILIHTYVYILSFYFISFALSSHVTFFSIAKDMAIQTLFDPLFITGYWFVWSYLVFILLIPYLNKIDVDKNVFVIFLLIMILNGIKSHSSWNWVFGADIVHFVCIFYISKYIFINYNSAFEKECIWIAPVFMLIMLVINICDNVIDKESVLSRLTVCRYGISSYAVALSLFYLFKKLPVKNRKIDSLVINFASLMFGVYLFHENPFLSLSSSVPGKLLANGIGILPSYFLSVLLLFLGGAIVDFIYSRLYFILVFHKGRRLINYRLK